MPNSVHFMLSTLYLSKTSGINKYSSLKKQVSVGDGKSLWPVKICLKYVPFQTPVSFLGGWERQSSSLPPRQTYCISIPYRQFDFLVKEGFVVFRVSIFSFFFIFFCYWSPLNELVPLRDTTLKRF